MAGFGRSVRDRSLALTTARESLESHLMAFATEQARVDGVVLNMDSYRMMAEQAALGPI